MQFNETIKEHLAIKTPGTMTAREMLTIENVDRITSGNLNYAGNIYLEALDEIRKAQEALQEIATHNTHLDDERFEETHGRVAMLMRRMAREALK